MNDTPQSGSPTGAQAIVHELVACGVTAFFSNPGTSEIHLVAAIDETPGARAILCLFEGVATGAADGYARASGRPAAVLLHLGPGLANGLANLHNALKARSPMIVIVGDHATDHLALDTPLRSDIDSLAKYASKATYRLKPGEDPRQMVHSAVTTATSRPAGPVVLVVSADLMWSAAPRTAPAAKTVDTEDDRRFRERTTDALIEQAVEALARGPKAVMLLGGGLTQRALRLADCIGQITNCRIYCETFNARHERGAGIPVAERLPYFQDALEDRLAGMSSLLLVGSRAPAAFFASPNRTGQIVQPGVDVVRLPETQSSEEFLALLAARLRAPNAPRGAERKELPELSGSIDAKGIWSVMTRHLPRDSIVSDEAGVTSVGSDAAMQGAEPHVWLNLTGGSIGQGLPVAVGAAIARSDTPVVAVHGDGGAMYTVQALWTAARENARVTIVIFKNGRYGILDYEAKRHGLGPFGAKGSSMFDLGRPEISWVAIATGMGVPAMSASTVEAFSSAFRSAVATPGPHLIEVVLSGRKS